MTLIEVMAVLAMIGVLVSMAAPSFRRSMEHSRADVAGSHLRAVWAAQRLHWLEYRAYAGDLATLVSEGLLDPTLVAGTSGYAYSISAADNSTFTALATRIGSARWTGQFAVDESGTISGNVQAPGEPPIVPGFL
jgi:prepilin-type N-terminal cleavage/methylation domain-containing protein